MGFVLVLIDTLPSKHDMVDFLMLTFHALQFISVYLNSFYISTSLFLPGPLDYLVCAYSLSI